jgi:hypothetical protein
MFPACFLSARREDYSRHGLYFCRAAARRALRRPIREIKVQTNRGLKAAIQMILSAFRYL